MFLGNYGQKIWSFLNLGTSCLLCNFEILRKSMISHRNKHTPVLGRHITRLLLLYCCLFLKCFRPKMSCWGSVVNWAGRSHIWLPCQYRDITWHTTNSLIHTHTQILRNSQCCHGDVQHSAELGTSSFTVLFYIWWLLEIVFYIRWLDRSFYRNSSLFQPICAKGAKNKNPQTNFNSRLDIYQLNL